MDSLYQYYDLLSDKDILALTAISVFIYTGLTFLLWRATKRQTDILHTPYLALRYSRDDKKFYIKNVGSDIATKIKIEGETIFVIDREIVLELHFNTVEMLEAGSEKEIAFEAYENGKRGTADVFAIYFFSRAAIKSQSPFKADGQSKRKYFWITFKNIFGKKYFYKIYIEDGEYRVKKFGQTNFLKLSMHNFYLIIQGLKTRMEVFIKRKMQNQK